MDGCALAAEGLSIADGALTVERSVPVSTRLQAIRRIRPLGGRVVFVSDLKPSKIVTRPFFDEDWPS